MYSFSNSGSNATWQGEKYWREAGNKSNSVIQHKDIPSIVYITCFSASPSRIIDHISLPTNLRFRTLTYDIMRYKQIICNPNAFQFVHPLQFWFSVRIQLLHISFQSCLFCLQFVELRFQMGWTEHSIIQLEMDDQIQASVPAYMICSA